MRLPTARVTPPLTGQLGPLGNPALRVAGDGVRSAYRHLSTAERRAGPWACTGRHLPWQWQRLGCRLGRVAPAVEGVRLHDLRHTFAALQLSAGVHFMQVSQWLGHSTYTLTLDVYGDYIPEEDGGAVNNLPEPTAPAKPADLPSNVVSLFGGKAN